MILKYYLYGNTNVDYIASSRGIEYFRLREWPHGDGTKTYNLGIAGGNLAAGTIFTTTNKTEMDNAISYIIRSMRDDLLSETDAETICDLRGSIPAPRD